MENTLREIQGEISAVLDQIDPAELAAFVACFDRARRCFVDGEGRSGLMGKGFAMRLMHLGYTVYVVGETITPAIGEGDLLVSVSGSGRSGGVLLNAQKAKEQGARVMTVTGKPDSELARLAEQVLTVPGAVRGDTGTERRSVQLLSSLFDQCLHIVLDAACLMLSRRDGVSNDAATAGHW